MRLRQVRMTDGSDSWAATPESDRLPPLSFVAMTLILQFELAFVVGGADQVGVAEEREHFVQVSFQSLRKALILGGVAQTML